MKPIKSIKNIKDMEAIRRELRQSGTAAEATLWKMLKNRQVDGIRFRRQFSIGRFVVDFYSPELNLVIELDGQVHYTSEAMEYDEQRTEFLQGAAGVTMLRFENKYVFQYPEMIIEKILEVKKNMDPSAGKPAPPLNEGRS